jgi:hypothetical protein
VDTELSKKIRDADTSEFPDFYWYEKPLQMGLWILWIVKEKVGIRRLTAKQISSITRDVKEISISTSSIALSFNRAGNKIHTYKEDGEVYYEIMQSGKNYLISQIKEGSIEVLYFEPGKRYASKRLLVQEILGSLRGELRIVDPYCAERTLDVLNKVRNMTKFLTKIENLRQRERSRFLRELQDFKSEPEHSNIEFRNYPYSDIHDRYIVSSDRLVILGHSIKSLGSKESFAIMLSRDMSRNIVEALNENFSRRWKQSTVL